MNLDWTILHWIQDTLVCPALDFLMPRITLLGNGGAVWLLAAAALLITKKYRRYGVLLLVGLALGVLTGNLTLKPLIARPRPCWVDESVRLLISNPTDYSFPSGLSHEYWTLTMHGFVWHTLLGFVASYPVRQRPEIAPGLWARDSTVPASARHCVLHQSRVLQRFKRKDQHVLCRPGQ